MSRCFFTSAFIQFSCNKLNPLPICITGNKMSAVRNTAFSYSVHQTTPMTILVPTTLTPNFLYFYAFHSLNTKVVFVDEALCTLTQSLIKQPENSKSIAYNCASEYRSIQST